MRAHAFWVWIVSSPQGTTAQRTYSFHDVGTRVRREHQEQHQPSRSKREGAMQSMRALTRLVIMRAGERLRASGRLLAQHCRPVHDALIGTPGCSSESNIAVHRWRRPTSDCFLVGMKKSSLPSPRHRGEYRRPWRPPRRWCV